MTHLAVFVFNACTPVPYFETQCPPTNLEQNICLRSVLVSLRQKRRSLPGFVSAQMIAQLDDLKYGHK